MWCGRAAGYCSRPRMTPYRSVRAIADQNEGESQATRSRWATSPRRFAFERARDPTFCPPSHSAGWLAHDGGVRASKPRASGSLMTTRARAREE